MTHHSGYSTGASLIRAFLAYALAIVAAFLSFGPGASRAQTQQLGIDIVNGNASAIPIAVVPFGFEGGGLAAGDRYRRGRAR